MLDPTAAVQLAAVVRWLKAHPRARLVVEGHADNSPDLAYNQAVAGRRARLVRTALIARGIAPDRIVLAVYGAHGALRPADRQDRRVVVFATMLPIERLIAAELARDALEVAWTHLGTRRSEARGITPGGTAASARQEGR